MHGRGRPVIEGCLLLAVGRQNGDDDGDENSYLQDGHVGCSNPDPSVLNSRPISTNCLMQSVKLRRFACYLHALTRRRGERSRNDP
jgi:hypothetical protein